MRALVDQARARFTKKWRLRFHLSALSEAAVEGAPNDQCARADQRGVSTADKTQANLPGQDAVLLLLFGLLRSGHVKMRKIDGWQEMERMTQAA